MTYPSVTFKIVGLPDERGGRATYSGCVQESLAEIIQRGCLAQFKDRCLHQKWFGESSYLREVEIAERIEIK